MLAHELEITLEASFIALTRRPWTGPRPLDGAPRETPPGTGWTIIIMFTVAVERRIYMEMGSGNGDSADP